MNPFQFPSILKESAEEEEEPLSVFTLEWNCIAFIRIYLSQDEGEKNEYQPSKKYETMGNDSQSKKHSVFLSFIGQVV